MSTARHHAEWLSLVEVSGPFLSMPVLLRALPQGLDAHDPDVLRELRLAHAEWRASQESDQPDQALHTAWIEYVLHRVLEWPKDQVVEGVAVPLSLATTIAEHGETLRADRALMDPGTQTPRMLVWVLPPGQDPERALAERRWKASPATRMMELLHATGVRLGLITNGESWMLVDAPRGRTTGFVSFYASLWLEEHITLRAFRTLLGARRFFAVAENDSLEALLEQSASDQQEVTDQLGYQVRKAVEVLVQAFDRIDRDRGRKLLEGVSERELYESALTVMMRLVFLLSAEERGLMLLGDPTYDAHYAVATLREQLREAADRGGEEVLERRHDAWARLLATFRAVHGGVQHESLRMPAYGGGLFDPDRYPFLEGRARSTRWREAPAQPLPIHNRTVLHLLEALQLLQVRVAGGGPAEARRLSFRALDIEQIGHVYEGLLDHSAVRAGEPVLGLAGAKDSEPEVPLSVLEAAAKKGRDTLLGVLAEQTGRSARALEKALDAGVAKNDGRWLAACDNRPELLARVAPFAGLVREDTAGYPIVITEGSVYVTQSSERRSTGTHYTPKSLTEPIVRYTLEPLVYEGPVEGKPREQWRLKSAREILALRVCDMAMGSGAFLVQACRYLAARLVESWQDAEEQASASDPSRRHVVITPEGGLSTGAPGERPLPVDVDERMAIARRVVADRCLYGVDKNPMAVEMAKLSLWLVTLQKGRPFEFLDHALKAGDSLLGLTRAEQLRLLHPNPGHGYQGGRQMPTFSERLGPALARAVEARRRLEGLAVESARDVEEKGRLLREAEGAIGAVRRVADAVVGAALAAAGKKGRALDAALADVAAEAERLMAAGGGGGAVSGSVPPGSGRRPFHWVLEFPEVFLDAAGGGGAVGFDAVVGNPPFMGGQKITGEAGTDYRDYLVEQLAGGTRGSADLCAYFFLRAWGLLNERGGFGLIATNTIAQGDTREVALDTLVAGGCAITRAVPSRKWPGGANLEVAHVWGRRGGWNGPWLLEEREVKGINAYLSETGAVEGKPYRLKENAGKSFQGSIVLGMGFVLEPEEAQALIAKDPRNREVLFPYLNGEDLNSRPDQSASRWVINFRDWPLDRATAPEGYVGPVAEDYPGCLRIVREKVKPERDALGDGNPTARDRSRRWWQFARPTTNLYATIAKMERVVGVSLVSNHVMFGRVPASWVFAHKLAIFPLPRTREFALLQSSFHYLWAWNYSSTMRVDLNYSPTDCFETFPFPASLDSLESIGTRYETYRSSLTRRLNLGLTKLYNRFHDPADTAPEITELRALHIELDRAVAAAYGWTDLDLGHGFHETRQGTRYTLSEPARREVLARLLELNHERYAAEQAAAAAAPDAPRDSQTRSKRPRRAAATTATAPDPQPTLFAADAPAAPRAKRAKRGP